MYSTGIYVTVHLTACKYLNMGIHSELIPSDIFPRMNGASLGAIREGGWVGFLSFWSIYPCFSSAIFILSVDKIYPYIPQSDFPLDYKKYVYECQQAPAPLLHY